jgi:hypothetical protein
MPGDIQINGAIFTRKQWIAGSLAENLPAYLSVISDQLNRPGFNLSYVGIIGEPVLTGSQHLFYFHFFCGVPSPSQIPLTQSGGFGWAVLPKEK